METLKTLLEARYGTSDPIRNEDDSATLDPTLETLLAHKSVRNFSSEPLPAGTLERIIGAAQSAASSSNLQAWSVVSVENPTLREEIRPLCGGQEFIRDAPLYLVFCADLSRLTDVAHLTETPGVALDYLEMFLLAVIDATLAAQNATVAAEAMGLGICYNGGARNHPRELAEKLKLPPRVFAVFGLAIGVPAETDSSTVKPRLPLSEVLFTDTYVTEHRPERLADYDATMQRFYTEQKMNVTGGWTEHSGKRVATTAALNGRDTIKAMLAEMGFPLL